MSLIILDRENEGGGVQMRHHMRNHMRSNYRNQIAGGTVSMKDEFEEGYKKGYEEAWHDCMEEMQGGSKEEYRRSRNSHGQFT